MKILNMAVFNLWQVGAGGDNGNRGKYEAYHQYLDKIKREQDVRKRQDGVPPPGKHITLIAPITTAADDKFCDIFSNFLKKIRYDIS